MKKTSLQIMSMLCVLFALINTAACAKDNTDQANTSDAMITSKVKSQMAVNPATKATTVAIETKDGVVIISGVADSNREAIEIVEIAASTPGVADVDTKALSVHKSSQPMTDSFITAKVKGALIKARLMGDAAVPPLDIKVTTRDGVVYLTGRVDTMQQRDEAVRIVKAVKGVKRVVSNIKVGKAK